MSNIKKICALFCLSFCLVASPAFAANKFWVGGTGSWDGTTTTHWSASSGGGGGVSVPTASDDVIFDANSGGGTVTLTATANCRSFNGTGFTGTVTGAQTINIGASTSGNFTLGSSMQTAGFAVTTVNFVSTTTGNQITTNNKLSGNNITFNGTAGAWQFEDAFDIGGSNGSITLTKGSLDFNAQTIGLGSFSSSGGNTRTLTITNATINLKQTGTVWTTSNSTGLTFNSTGSTINITSTAAVNKNFIGGSLTFGALTIATSANRVRVESASTFQSLMVTAPVTIQFDSSSTTTIITPPTWVGSSGNLVTVNASTAGTAATLSVASGTAICDWLSVKDSTATGGATFYAGANSTNVSGNTGWIFTAPPAPGTARLFFQGFP